MNPEKSLRLNKPKTTLQTVLRYKYFYIMLLPVIIWYIIFAYAPMYGITLAFKTFNYSKGIMGSPWVGLKNFQDLMVDADFWSAFKNTIIIGFGKLLFCFPIPIILSILLNECVFTRGKKIVQTVLTFPHFISWVVLAGILTNILGNSGVINQLIALFGKDSVAFLSNSSIFRPVLYFSQAWKETGWDSIIYIAALAGINPELYEAAQIDGVNRWQKIRYISWPGIRPTVAILLILAVGQMLSVGSSFDQIFNLYSSPVYGVADTIDTYVYRTTFTVGADFGYMTAVGFLKSTINLAMIFLANTIVRKSGEQGLF